MPRIVAVPPRRSTLTGELGGRVRAADRLDRMVDAAFGHLDDLVGGAVLGERVDHSVAPSFSPARASPPPDRSR